MTRLYRRNCFVVAVTCFNAISVCFFVKKCKQKICCILVAFYDKEWIKNFEKVRHDYFYRFLNRVKHSRVYSFWMGEKLKTFSLSSLFCSSLFFDLFSLLFFLFFSSLSRSPSFFTLLFLLLFTLSWSFLFLDLLSLSIFSFSLSSVFWFSF